LFKEKHFSQRVLGTQIVGYGTFEKHNKQFEVDREDARQTTKL